MFNQKLFKSAGLENDKKYCPKARLFSLGHSLHGPPIVWSVPLKQVNLSSRHTADGSVPTVLDAAVNIACVETLKSNVKRHISLRKKVSRFYFKS